jgi:acetylornithine/N-succinyldiaminopimelate aminotransferase
MAVGNAVLDVVLADGFMESISRKGLQFKQSLAAVADEFPDIIEGVRGEGLMLGIKCKVQNLRLLEALRDQKMLVVPAGDNVLRLLPPLIITEDEIREAVKRIHDAAAAVRATEKADA